MSWPKRQNFVKMLKEANLNQLYEMFILCAYAMIFLTPKF